MDVDVDVDYINHICTRRILGDAPAIQELSVRRRIGWFKRECGWM